MQENASGETSLLPQILLVEDQDKVLQQFGWALEEAGYSLWRAFNNGEAIELLRQHLKSLVLVLTDFRWPDTEGIIARLLELKPSLRFCFVSDKGVQYLDGRLWDLGPSPLLQKPFQMEQFVSAVALILRLD